MAIKTQVSDRFGGKQWLCGLLWVLAYWMVGFGLNPAVALEQKGEASTKMKLPKSDELLKSLSGELAVSLEGQTFSEGVDDSQGVRLGLRMTPQLQLSERFFLTSHLQFQSTAGRVQTRFDEKFDEAFLHVNEAALAYRWNQNIELSGGVINQEHLKASLLVHKRGFPGLRQFWTQESERFKVQFSAQEVIPTSTTLSSERTEKEPLPTLFTQSARIEMNVEDEWELSGQLTHYDYNDLPSVVAYESLQYGNFIDGELAPTSRFKYDFDGLFFSLGATHHWSENLSAKFSGEWMQNMAAPTGRNRAQLLTVQMDLGVGSVTISPLASLFFAESDVAPSYYMRGDMGRSNREGHILGFDVAFKNIKLEGRFAEADTINISPLQQRFVNYSLKLETFYEF